MVVRVIVRAGFFTQCGGLVRSLLSQAYRAPALLTALYRRFKTWATTLTPTPYAHLATGLISLLLIVRCGHTSPFAPHMPSHLFPHHALWLRLVSLQRSTRV